MCHYLQSIDVEYHGSSVYSREFMHVLGHEDDKSDNLHDINKGFGGKYVYLVPRWSSDRHCAADTIEVHIEEHDPEWARHRGLHDVAKGAGGSYRFVVPQNYNNACKITEVALWSGSHALERAPDCWTDFTSDINRGRGGRYLHVVYKRH